MNKTILITCMMIIANLSGHAQSNAETLSEKIAQRMKDSLSLKAKQKEEVFQVNMQLHNLKMNARELYKDFDLAETKIQKIEDSRDGLYKKILSSEQFALYLQKKGKLISNN